MKKSVLFLCLLIFANIFMTNPIFAVSDSNISVLINDKQPNFKNKPQIIDGRTMIPLREIAEYLGLEVEYDSETKKITCKNNNNVIIMYIDDDTLFIIPIGKNNGTSKNIKMDVVPTVIDGTTYIPAKYLVENFGYTAEWDNDNRQVLITDNISYYIYHQVDMDRDKFLKLASNYNNWIDLLCNAKTQTSLENAVETITSELSVYADTAENSNERNYLKNITNIFKEATNTYAYLYLIEEYHKSSSKATGEEQELITKLKNTTRDLIVDSYMYIEQKDFNNVIDALTKSSETAEKMYNLLKIMHN